MAGFLDVALSTASIERACASAGVEIGDYLRARRTDLVFAAECVELDIVLKLATSAMVQARAAAGDWRAAKMVAAGQLDLRAAMVAEQDRLPYWLNKLCRQVRSGLADPFILAALESAYDLAERIQSQGKAPVGWKPGEQWRTKRFTADDVASIFDRKKYHCESCGSIAYRGLLQWPRSDHSDLDWHRDDDGRWTADNGWRCPKCGARSGLPWTPASKPPDPASVRPPRREPSDPIPHPDAQNHDPKAYLSELAAIIRRNGGHS